MAGRRPAGVGEAGIDFTWRLAPCRQPAASDADVDAPAVQDPRQHRVKGDVGAGKQQ